jgi:hypothetical protein
MLFMIRVDLIPLRQMAGQFRDTDTSCMSWAVHLSGTGKTINSKVNCLPYRLKTSQGTWCDMAGAVCFRIRHL